MCDVNEALAAAAEASKRQAVRAVLERKFGRAVPVTEEMIDSVIGDICEGCYEPLDGGPNPCAGCAANAW